MVLKVNIGKTEVQVISKRDITIITINYTPLKHFEDFIYLGGKNPRRDPVLTTLNTELGKHLVQCKI